MVVVPLSKVGDTHEDKLRRPGLASVSDEPADDVDEVEEADDDDDCFDTSRW